MEALDLLGMADHPALELLNSTVDVPGRHLDVLEDGEGLLRWLSASGLRCAEQVDALRASYPADDLHGAAAETREFRERMRPVVADWAAADGGPSEQALQDVNALLARDRRHLVLAGRPGALRLGEAHDWTDAAALLALPAASVADLLAHGDPALVRRCDGCSLWFYDRTKNHQRRWCSMAGCGNRAKARANRARKASSRGATTVSGS